MSLTRVTYSMIDGGYVNAIDFGAVGDGIADDTNALNAAIAEAYSSKQTLYIPAGTYLISSSLDISGIQIVGDLAGYLNSAGTVIKSAGTSHPLLEQKKTSAADITYSISNLRLDTGSVGLKMTYAVGCIVRNLGILNCTNGIELGLASAAGPLFNTFMSVTTTSISNFGLVMNGASWCNSNYFENCFFVGDEIAVTVQAAGGLGALNNHFIDTEFSSNKYGLKVAGAKNTVVIGGYFETHGPSVLVDGACYNLDLRSCVWAGVENTNATGHNSFIFHNSGLAYLSVSNGWVYLPTGAERNNIEFAYSAAPSTFYLNIPEEPVQEIGASGWVYPGVGLQQSNLNITDSASFTPVWEGSVSNPSIGNGVLSGRWSRNGKTVQVDYFVQIGSTTSVGSGNWTFDLPIATSQMTTGSWYVLDSGTGFHTGVAFYNGAKVTLPIGGGSTSVGSATPITWATGDQLVVSLTYTVA